MGGGQEGRGRRDSLHPRRIEHQGSRQKAWPRVSRKREDNHQPSQAQRETPERDWRK